jgi:hypothetical protein
MYYNMVDIPNLNSPYYCRFSRCRAIPTCLPIWPYWACSRCDRSTVTNSTYLSRIRFEFLARIYFFRRLELPGLEEFVAEQKTICLERVEALARAASETNAPFARLVLEFRKGQLEASIQWLDRCLEKP